MLIAAKAFLNEGSLLYFYQEDVGCKEICFSAKFTCKYCKKYLSFKKFAFHITLNKFRNKMGSSHEYAIMQNWGEIKINSPQRHITERTNFFIIAT
jgi:hypothetical protein